MITIHGLYHPKADTYCLYVPGRDGGRVLKQTGAYIAEVMKLMEYISTKDPLIQIVRTHQHHTNSTLLQTDKNVNKSFQSGMKKIKNNSSECKRKKKRKECMDNSHVA
jgi:hypothetical protein